MLVIKKNNKREEKAAEEQSSKITEVKPVAEQAPENHLFVSDRIPSDFVNLVKYFYPAVKSIEEFWRMRKVRVAGILQAARPEAEIEGGS
ncbi:MULTISPECIES: hypothetical protein [Mesobacillus]|uniref:Uncharacterized protein n=2 Tax=Mesobacillus TaxID=2675231 RepID=A0A0D6Z5S3_9BACI|nr:MULTISPECIES: hypothetical protein [Mesobacillus]KIY20932.1 hypothetical protein UB32_16485 [Mesobacillus subterraneus]MDQ0415401.1 hypothetical protein [Mesobacillus stamsii]